MRLGPAFAKFIGWLTMPFRSGKQRRFFLMCLTPEGRRKAKDKCPPLWVIRRFVEEEKKRKGRKRK